MTNALVMGEVMQLDTFLWQIHTVTRNFANFALGALLLRLILKGMVSQSDNPASELTKKIGRLLAA